MKRLLTLVLMAMAMSIVLPSRPALASTAERCFAETGFCISGRIRQYWESNGGLPVFGFPKSAQGPMLIEGKTFIAQNFERNRLELHPENAAPYDVLLGRLGALNMISVFNAETSDVVSTINFNTESFSDGGLLKDSNSCKWFEQTRQFVCNEFLTYWKSHGLQLDGKPGFTEAESLALFGLPLSYRFTTTLEGTPRVVQIFERARFELHEDKPEPYRVLLGLLGNQYLGGNAPMAAGAPVTNEPVKTGEMNNFIRFDLGTAVTSIEIASAGSERWLSFVDTRTNQSAQASSGSVWGFTIPIFDNKKSVDIRLNSAVIWRNVEVRENSLVVLGYKNGPDFTGPYVVSIQDNYR
jgi:hypothetical protein